MSSNVPTNEQNAAVADGSDTDSVSSLSSQTANLNLERSSPPPPLSSQASDDEGDITITKDPHGDDNPDEDGQIPFLDNYGKVSVQSKQYFKRHRVLYSYPRMQFPLV